MFNDYEKYLKNAKMLVERLPKPEGEKRGAKKALRNTTGRVMFHPAES